MSAPLTANEITLDAGKNPAPLPEADDAVVSRVKECEKRAREQCGDWYEEAKTDFEFYESKQWSAEDESALKDQDRIPVTFNRVAATINAICGQEVANRQEVRYLPRRVGPVSGADPMNDAVKWVREQCNAEDEDSDAFRDHSICGMGWTVLRMDYETEADGRPEVVRRDPLLMRWDPAARRKNLADASWQQSDYWMRKEAIQAKWPDAELDMVVKVERDSDRANPIDTTENWKYEKSSAGTQKKGDEYRVTHHVERGSVTKYRMVDPASQQMREYGQDEYDTLQENHAALPDAVKQAMPLPEAVPVQRRVYWEAWVCGGVVLACGVTKAQKEFPYQCMTCYRERDTGYWFGVVRLMRDPQRYANLFMSLMVSILGTGAKGGVMYETGAFANPKKALDDWARHNSAVELTNGSLAAGRVQPKPPAQMPPAAADLMQFAIGSIRDVTGVNIELLGQANNNETGVVEDMKSKAGLTILASVFDAMRLYRKRQGVILAEYIEKFISDGRLIRILGPDGEQFIPLLRDPMGMEYDIVVDESPSSRDVKERTWMTLQVVLPMMLQMGMSPPPEVVDYAPLPQSLGMKIKQAIQQKMQQPQQPPPEMQIEQLRQQGEQAKMQGQAQIKQQELQAQDQMKQRELAAQQAVQQSNDARDAMRAQQEFQLKREELALKFQLEERSHLREQETAIQIAWINAQAKTESAEISATATRDQAVFEAEAQGATQ